LGPNLGQTCDARANHTTKAEVRDEPEDVSSDLRLLRTWADKTHFTGEDIQKLRQLIQPMAAQPQAASRNSIIVIVRKEQRARGFFSGVHRSKFPHTEWLVESNDALLTNENRPAVPDPDGERNRDPQWQ